MKKKILFIVLFLIPGAIHNNAYSSAASSEQKKVPESLPIQKFEDAFQEYVKLAKDLSEKKMTEDDERKLAEIAKSIITNLQKEYITENLKPEEFYLTYRNNTDNTFPDMTKYNLKDANTDQITRFIIGTYIAYQMLTDPKNDYILQIAKKSPLELVVILKEFKAFLEFISVPQKKYGQGIPREKIGNKTAVYVDDNDIKNVATPIVYENLLNSASDRTFKMSRITSSFCNQSSEFNGKNQNDIMLKSIDTLKRNTADDNRLTISRDLSINIPADIIIPENTGTGLATDINVLRNNLIEKVESYIKNPTNPDVVREIILHEKEFIGIRDNIKDPILWQLLHIDGFTKKLDEKIKDLTEKSNGDDKKVKRDLENCTEISLFLKETSKLLKSLYEDKNFLKNIIQTPLTVISIGNDILMFLSILDMIIDKPDDTNSVIEKMREFVKISDDGSYLLSSTLSSSMENNADIKTRRYLKIR